MSFKNYPARGGSVRHLSSFPQYQSLAETYGCSAVHKSFLSDYFARCSSLYHLDLLGHYGCVNAIEFSNNGGEFIVSGLDVIFLLLWPFLFIVRSYWLVRIHHIKHKLNCTFYSRWSNFAVGDTARYYQKKKTTTTPQWISNLTLTWLSCSPMGTPLSPVTLYEWSRQNFS